jgi:asparagine synthase (glutamine-hydrolysing)
MCGIAGLWLPDADPAGLVPRARAMANALRHRGPDGAGVWHDPAACLALAQRRLAIIDLSPGGAQPMADRSGRWVITYNGELYNFRALRDELASLGFPPRGASDTAVLLEAIACWGIEAALPRLNGMFAFAAWDRRERLLWLARDHAGIKPLVFHATDRALAFGSETKALLAAGLFPPRLDAAAAAAFLRDACVPAPQSALEGVRALRPGEVLAFDAPGRMRARRWFDPAALGRSAFRGSPAEAEATLGHLLADAVRLQQVADVPVGAFLSGGVDSSLVTSLMDRPRTFTIGFSDAAYAEQLHAEAVAAALGTTHTTLVAEAGDVRALLPAWLDAMDEPFADSSVLPTLLLSRLTRQHATVALSGDGGDELFGGYRRHLFAHRHWPRLARWPRALRVLGGRAIRAVPEPWLDRALAPMRLTRPGEALHKLAMVVDAPDAGRVHARFAAVWPEAAATPAPLAAPAPGDPLLESRRADFARYLPEDVLTKVDRAAMMVALEVRVPFLDPRVIDFAFSLPPALLFDAAGGKAILRRLLARRVPATLTERPKMGFSIPLGAWLRGPWRDWAEALLEERRLRDAGLYDVGVVRAAWAEHIGGRVNRHHALWCVLMLEAWRERVLSARGAAAPAPTPDWPGADAPPPAPTAGAPVHSASA